MNPLAVVGLIIGGAAMIAMASWIYYRAERECRAAVRKLEGQGLSIREIARRVKCSPAGAMKILKGK